MNATSWRPLLALAAGLALAGPAWAALPPPAPAQAQAQAAAAKKAEADAKAARDKEALAASMDRISGRWRQRAAQEGWSIQVPPPVSGPSGIAASDPTPASALTFTHISEASFVLGKYEEHLRGLMQGQEASPHHCRPRGRIVFTC